MRALFKLLSLLADIKAVKKGKVPQRLARKAGYRAIRKTFR